MYYLVTNRKTEEEVQFYSIEEVREFLDTQKDSDDVLNMVSSRPPKSFGLKI